ncbi:MAG TPA: folate-binding protein [Terriglobales bacterium]|nr:folate-binding protein [Terriglobales bacterium]
MAASALTEKLTAAGASGQYGGAETVLRFSDSKTEFAALLSGAGVCDLCWRAKLAIRGRDRVRWFNGMVSNNVRDLAAGRGVYSFVLNPQGRILGDFYAWNHGEEFLVDTDLAQLPNLLALWRKFIIMDKVELVEVADQFAAIGVQGPKAAEVLRAAGIQVPELQPLEMVESSWQQGSLTLVRADEPKVRYEVWLTPEHAAAAWDALVKAGATPVGAEAIELARIAAGIPKYGQDIRERDLPQETQQERALNFTKGCYIGQEIVERIRSRGNVHRMFTGLKIEGPLPAPGAKLQADGKDVGEVTSVGVLPLAGGQLPVALGYVRREAGSLGSFLTAGETKATVQPPPFT